MTFSGRTETVRSWPSCSGTPLSTTRLPQLGFEKPFVSVKGTHGRRLQEVALTDELGDEPGLRRMVYLQRCSELFQPALVHHRDPARHRERLGLVVGDIQAGDAEFSLHAFELDPHLVAESGVEVGQRLVEEHQRGIGHERACEGEPLLLPARQVVAGRSPRCPS